MILENTEQHTMQLELTHPSGVEEWACPTCERRFVVQWPPVYSRFNRIILEEGDENAFHSGGKGGLKMSSVQVTEPEEPGLSEQWFSALDDLDFGDWPDESE